MHLGTPLFLGLAFAAGSVAAAAAGSPADSGKASRTSYVRAFQIGAKTYYLLIDTGANRTALPLADVARVQNKRLAWQNYVYIATSEAILVKVYKVPKAWFMGCRLRDVEVIALPGAQHGFIGTQALRQVMPFTFTNRGFIPTCHRPKK